MIIVIESGAIYSAGLLSLLITYACGSNGQYPALDAELPLVGIAFNLIIVRVGLGLAQNSTTPGGVSSRGLASRRQNPTGRIHMPKITTSTHQLEDGPYPLQPLERGVSVKVSQTQQNDSGSNNESFIEPADSKWTPV